MLNNYTTIARFRFFLLFFKLHTFLHLFFIQQGPFNLIKHNSKDIIMLQKTYISNKCCSFRLCSLKNTEKYTVVYIY